jgi:hypothetical protein
MISFRRMKDDIDLVKVFKVHVAGDVADLAVRSRAHRLFEWLLLLLGSKDSHLICIDDDFLYVFEEEVYQFLGQGDVLPVDCWKPLKDRRLKRVVDTVFSFFEL